MPSQLGKFTKLSSKPYFFLYSNKLCADLPAEVTALSSSRSYASSTSYWSVKASTSIGTLCVWESSMDDSRFPTMGTTATSQSYTSKTGTIPTEFGLMSDVTSFSLYSNTFSSIPTELGMLEKVSTNLNL